MAGVKPAPPREERGLCYLALKDGASPVTRRPAMRPGPVFSLRDLISSNCFVVMRRRGTRLEAS